MKIWKVKLPAGGRTFCVGIGIFLGNALLPLLLVIVIMPLSHIVKKCTGGQKLSKLEETSDYLAYMDGIKLLAEK